MQAYEIFLREVREIKNGEDELSAPWKYLVTHINNGGTELSSEEFYEMIGPITQTPQEESALVGKLSGLPKISEVSFILFDAHIGPYFNKDFTSFTEARTDGTIYQERKPGAEKMSGLAAKILNEIYKKREQILLITPK